MPFDPTLGASLKTGQTYDLAAMVRAKNSGMRRKTIVLRAILPTNAQASDLYQRAYKPLITAMQVAIPAIVAAYERGLPVRDALIRDSTAEAQQQTESLGQQLQRLVVSLLPGLADWTVRTQKWHDQKWRSAILTPTGVDIGTLLLVGPQPKSVGETIAWNTALIRDVGQQAQTRMSQAIFSAFQARKPAADLAGDIRGIVDTARARSLRIASDQLSKLSSALDSERMAEAGIDEFRWMHSGKRHPRRWHLARNGKIYDLNTGKEVGGGDTIAPDDMPGVPPFCGCRKLGVIRF